LATPIVWQRGCLGGSIKAAFHSVESSDPNAYKRNGSPARRRKSLSTIRIELTTRGYQRPIAQACSLDPEFHDSLDIGRVVTLISHPQVRVRNRNRGVEKVFVEAEREVA